MAIVLLASWLGITVTPTELLRANDFNSTHFIYTGIALSAGLGLAAYVTKRYNLKKHFEFTYFNFALNIGFIAALSGLFVLGNDWLWYIIIALMIFYCITFALKMKSFYILIITVAYGYIALNNLLWTLMTNLNMVSAYLALFWLIFSSIMIIKYLRDIKHRFQDDSL